MANEKNRKLLLVLFNCYGDTDIQIDHSTERMILSSVVVNKTSLMTSNCTMAHDPKPEFSLWFNVL